MKYTCHKKLEHYRDRTGVERSSALNIQNEFEKPASTDKEKDISILIYLPHVMRMFKIRLFAT